ANHHLFRCHLTFCPDGVNIVRRPDSGIELFADKGEILKCAQVVVMNDGTLDQYMGKIKGHASGSGIGRFLLADNRVIVCAFRIDFQVRLAVFDDEPFDGVIAAPDFQGVELQGNLFRRHQRVLAVMAVFDINAMQYDGDQGKLLIDGNIDLFDPDGCIELFVRFTDELLNDPVLVQKDGNG